MYTFEQVKSELAKQIADAMYMEVDEIPEQGLFSSFGLESITLVRIVEEVNKVFGASVEVRDILPQQTLHDASNVIFKHISGEQ